MTEVERAPGRMLTLGLVALVSLVLGSVVGLFVVPADALQGEVQRLLYVHVPSAWLAMLSFFIVFLMSLLYLIQRKERWDLIAAAAAEIGVLFTALTLAQGSIWGKPTWGIWWTWDPRLTTTAIMFIIYVGYLLVRSFAEEPERRARWAAIVGIVGFVNVPIVYLSVTMWRSIHQPPSTPESVHWTILLAFLVNLFAFTLVYAYLLVRRYRLAEAERRLEEAAAERRLEEAAARAS